MPVQDDVLRTREKLPQTPNHPEYMAGGFTSHLNFSFASMYFAYHWNRAWQNTSEHEILYAIDQNDVHRSKVQCGREHASKKTGTIRIDCTSNVGRAER